MATLASPTLGKLLTNVRNFLGQPNPSNSRWSDQELTEYLNEAVRMYFAEVILNAEGQFSAVSDLNIVSDTETVDLPTDFYEVIRLYKKTNDSYEILSYQNNLTDGYTTQGGSGGSTYFPYYFFRGNKLVLRPTPNFSETAGLRLEYIQFPDTMVNGGDSLTSSVSPIFKQLIEMYAVYKAKVQESLTNNTNLYGPAQENLTSIYGMFKTAISGRSKSPQYTVPFNPEGEGY